MPRLSLIILVGLVALSSLRNAHVGAAYEHVRNGGFELGLEGWRHAGAVSGSSERSAEGGHSARIVVDAGTAALSQSLPPSLASGAYDVTALAYTDATGAAGYLDLVTSNGTLTGSAPLVPGQWTLLRLQAHLAVAADATLKVRVQGAPGDVAYVDAVRLTGAPPVTLTPTPIATPPPAAETAVPSPTAPAPTPTPEAVVDTIAAHLRNPDFEELGPDGLPFAWQKFGGFLAGSSRPRSGARAATLASDTGSTKWLYQAVLVDPGATYDFGAWILHDDPAVAQAFIRVSWYASSDGSGSAIGTSDSPASLTTPDVAYRPLSSGPVTAPAGARSAKLRIMLAPRSSAPASITVDDAWFQPAAPPEPTPVTAVPVDETNGDRSARSDGAGGPERISGGRTTRASFTSPRQRVDGAPRAPGAIVINEVLYNPDTEAPDADSEWVELYNRSSEPVLLDGWSLQDNARRTMLPAIVVPPMGFAVVAATRQFSVDYEDYAGVWAPVGGRLGNGLGNDGDVIELVDPAGSIADAVSWGDDTTAFDPPVEEVPAGHSIERVAAGADTDRASDFTGNYRPSPGRPLPPESSASAGDGRTRTLDVLDGTRSPATDWLPWVIVAISGAALVAAAGWRGLEFMRGRARGA